MRERKVASGGIIFHFKQRFRNNPDDEVLAFSKKKSSRAILSADASNAGGNGRDANKTIGAATPTSIATTTPIASPTATFIRTNNAVGRTKSYYATACDYFLDAPTADTKVGPHTGPCVASYKSSYAWLPQ